MNKPRKGGHSPQEGFARGKRRKRRPGRHAKETANPESASVPARNPVEGKPAEGGTGAMPHGERSSASSGRADANPARTDGKSARKRRRRGRKGQPDAIAAASTPAETARESSPDANPSPAEGTTGRRRKRRRAKARMPFSANAAEEPIRYLRAPAKSAPRPSFQPVKSRNNARHGKNAEPYKARDANGAPRRFQANGASRPAYAALDLGTNNCRLLVAVPTQGERFRVIDAFSRIVRLGEGMAASGRLSDAAMDRALEALAICAAKMASHDLAGYRLIATEACRRAVNGEGFLDRVFAETGLRLEVVDRETEARLAAEGCGSLMDPRAEGAVLFDIGGGSSELVLIDRSRRRSRDGRISDHIAAWTSLPTGVVTLSERHGGRHVTPAIFGDMVADVLEQLAAFEGRSGLADIWHPARSHLLGTSGTVTTIAGVHLKLPRYERRKVDGIWLSDGQVDAVIDTLVEMDYEARSRNPCIGKERADLVLAGCAILQAIRLTWPSPRLRVADRGLREGILAELMHAAGEWETPRGNGRDGHRPAQASRPPHPAGTP